MRGDDGDEGMRGMRGMSGLWVVMGCGHGLRRPRRTTATLPALVSCDQS